jgi:biotin transport system substrate-specific component
MVKAALLAALIAATSQLSIPQPFSAVPITLQVFFVLLAGAVLGPLYGSLSMVVYVLLGLAGLPVFANGGSGIGTLVGPTGGYLIGFILATGVIGWIVSAGKASMAQILLAMGAGIIVIYTCGVMQLSFVAKMAIGQAIIAGAGPFIVLDFAKAIVAALVAKRVIRSQAT